jgi:hypothetical protein
VLQVMGVNGCKCSWLIVIVVAHYRGYELYKQWDTRVTS